MYKLGKIQNAEDAIFETPAQTIAIKKMSKPLTILPRSVLSDSFYSQGILFMSSVVTSPANISESVVAAVVR